MSWKLDLDEREYALNIVQRLRQDQRHCDFIVSVDGEEFHTHRSVLSAGSDYFKAMLTHDTRESQLGKVEMMDVDSECVRICIDYIYTGKAEIPDGKTQQFIHVATLMQLDKLSDAFSQLLVEYLDTNTFYSIRTIAEIYSLQYLLATCITFEQEYIIFLSYQDDFQREEYVHIVEIMTSMPLTEQEKLIISLRWVGSLEERKSNLLDILKWINLDEVPEDYLHEILEINPLIKNDLDLYEIFSVALVKKLYASRNGECGDKSLIFFTGDRVSLRRLNLKSNNVEKFRVEKYGRFGYFSATALHSYIYIINVNKSVHRLSYLGKEANWERMEDMIECHGSFPPSISLNDFLYVVGGNCGKSTNAAEKFCPAENQWVRLIDMPVLIQKSVLVTMGGSIYSLGNNSEGSNAFYEFNTQSAEWSELPPMWKEKHSYGAVAWNQKIYVLGGEVGPKTLNDMECYGVTLKQWASLSPMINSCYMIKAHYISGWIFAVPRSTDSDAIEKYDIEKDEWQKVVPNGTYTFQILDSVPM